MKKIFILVSIVLGLFGASVSATNFSVSGLPYSELIFRKNGNDFWGSIFFKDTINVSETVILNWIPKSCTKQIRWYYYNAWRGQRLWPLDQDSLTTLRAYNASYANLTLQWGLFLCDIWSVQGVYGSISHLLWWQTYYIIAGVTYPLGQNSYLPNFSQSMFFLGGQTRWALFDSRGGIALLDGDGLTITDPVTWGWWGWGWWGGGWWGWGWWATWHNNRDDIWSTWTLIDIPIYSGLVASGTMVDKPEIRPLHAPCSVTNSPYSPEVTAAFSFSYSMGISSQCPIQTANLPGVVLRKHAAKMISQFAINVLGKKLDATKKCNFTDMWGETLEFQRYAKIACQLGIMWLDSSGKPISLFSPSVTLTRAQFGTMLSRLLRWTTYNGKPWQWYAPHLQALNANGIMKNISNPMMDEKRQNVMIMFYRIANSAE
jgi:hypothetical protein